MSVFRSQLAVILSRTWWALLLRGLVAIAFGVLAWRNPGISLATLVLLFGVFTLADGILGVWTAIAGRGEHDDWWVLLLGGLLGVGIGILTFAAPGITTLALLFYIAVWAIATGALQIVAAIRLRQEIQGEWLLVLGGLLSVVLGVFLMARPGEGAVAVVRIIAAYAVIWGVVLVMLAFRVRKLALRVQPA